MNVSSGKNGGMDIKRTLLIWSERISRMADWEDRGSCILFGDGAGCTVLERREEQTGIIASFLKNYDDINKTLWCGLEYEPNPFSGDEAKEKRTLKMSGTQVFRFAVNAVNEVMEKTLEYAGMTADDVDLFIPHQANLRIIKSAAARFKKPLDKFRISIGETGNVSAASIPMALYDAMKEGTVKTGDIVMLVGFGGGLSAGASLIKMW
jgi:3-oxoacyl-[acyl-carrier-protein] synthase-3